MLSPDRLQSIGHLNTRRATLQELMKRGQEQMSLQAEMTGNKQILWIFQISEITNNT